MKSTVKFIMKSAMKSIMKSTLSVIHLKISRTLYYIYNEIYIICNSPEDFKDFMKYNRILLKATCVGFHEIRNEIWRISHEIHRFSWNPAGFNERPLARNGNALQLRLWRHNHGRNGCMCTNLNILVEGWQDKMAVCCWVELRLLKEYTVRAE